MFSALRGKKTLTAEADEFAESQAKSGGYGSNCHNHACFDSARMVVSNRSMSRS